MMRTTQVVGLHPRAKKIVTNWVDAVEEVTRKYADGTEERYSRIVMADRSKREVYGYFDGMCGEEYPLHKWTLADGRVFYEYVQAQPWSSGPVVFVALEDEKRDTIKESLWTAEEMKHQL